MKTFEEALGLLEQSDIETLFGKHRQFIDDIYASDGLAIFVGKALRAANPKMSDEEFSQTATVCVQMLFTGLVIGIEMEKP